MGWKQVCLLLLAASLQLFATSVFGFVTNKSIETLSLAHQLASVALHMASIAAVYYFLIEVAARFDTSLEPHTAVIRGENSDYDYVQYTSRQKLLYVLPTISLALLLASVASTYSGF